MGASRGTVVGTLLAILAIAALPAPVLADTTVAGTLTGDQVWTKSGSPYILADNVTVGSGGSLTIEPGVEVRSNGPYRLNAVGVLDATGTPADPIDISLGNGLRFYSGSAGSEIAWATIRDSASFGIRTEIDAQNKYGAWPEVHDVVFRDNRFGVYPWYPSQGSGSISNARFLANDYGLMGVGGNFVADRVLVADSTYTSADLSNNNGQSWTITRSNLLPPTTSADCGGSGGMGCTMTVYHGAYDAREVWWGTTDALEIGRRIFDGNDDPSRSIVSKDPIATEPYDLYPPTSAPTAGETMRANGRWLPGTASDAGAASSGIARVEVSLQDLGTGLWWDGSAWVGEERFRKARGTTAWRISVPSLTPGNSYRVRTLAHDLAGNAQFGATAATFIADGSAPTVSAPVETLTEGSALRTTTMPVQVGWSGLDDLAAADDLSYDLQQRVYSGGVWSAWTNAGANLSDETAVRFLAPGARYQLRVRARDEAGNVSPYSTGPVFTASLYSDTAPSPPLAYGGSWQHHDDPGAYGGSVRYSNVVGSTATLTFLGRRAAVAMPLRASLGSAQICVDPGSPNESCSVVDLSPPSGLGARKLVFVRNDLAPSTAHRVTVTVLSGRVDLDEIAVLR